jgi:lipopolysaccharide/colanic/teichoic acid biosynthesis glycosyltransferase
LSKSGENSVALPAPSFSVRRQTQPTRRERCFDLALTIPLLPLLLIAGALIALALYIDSPGPVLFTSERVGRDGRLFAMLKFRKMRSGATGPAITTADDERFTPIGRFLAATRLDELPQIWNVLRGDMRLVGPRPELTCFVDEFAEAYGEILTVTPGITGVAQLRFLNEAELLHGEDPAKTYSDHVLPQKVEIDIEYVRSRSLTGDLAIIARTLLVPAVLLAGVSRSRFHGLRPWLPAVGLAGALVVLFLVSSSNIL